MVLRWFTSRKKAKGPKSIPIFLGFFFLVNYCLGTGFLGIPHSFFYAGYLAAIPTLLLISFVSWNNAVWEVETMARAQAIDSWRREENRRDGQLQSESESEKELLINGETADKEQLFKSHPKYEIRLTRKFEPIELCEVFLTRWGKYGYMIIWSFNCFLSGWSYTTVAGSAWATNIPFNTPTIQRCTADDFLGVLIPQDTECWNAYMLCVLFFAVIVVPFSLLDLKEQVVMHTILGLLRFVTIIMIVLYCIIKLSAGTNECSYIARNVSVFENNTLTLENVTKYGFSDLSDIVLRFDPKGWLVSIPVISFALLFHQGIPSLTHPIKEKLHLRHLMTVMFGVSTLSYLSLGIAVPLLFRANIQETATLNWVPLSMDRSMHPALQALFFYIVLFPSIDVVSAFPLTTHAISNNIFMLICGRDTSRKSKHPKRDSFIYFTIKLVSAVLPIVAALFISNLIYVLKYGGTTSFFICFIFPTALQLASIWVCSKTFAPRPETVEMKKLGGESSIFKEEEKLESAKSESTCTSIWKSLSLMCANYQTPYSNRFLSHPIVVAVIGMLGVLLFLLGLSSLIVHPEQVFCQDQP